jgi:hypothetical protein
VPSSSKLESAIGGGREHMHEGSVADVGSTSLSHIREPGLVSNLTQKRFVIHQVSKSGWMELAIV